MFFCHLQLVGSLSDGEIFQNCGRRHYGKGLIICGRGCPRDCKYCNCLRAQTKQMFYRLSRQFYSRKKHSEVENSVEGPRTSSAHISAAQLTERTFEMTGLGSRRIAEDRCAPRGGVRIEKLFKVLS